MAVPLLGSSHSGSTAVSEPAALPEPGVPLSLAAAATAPPLPGRLRQRWPSLPSRDGVARTLSAHPLALALSVVVAAAVLPYLSTLRGYFIAEDFGMTQSFIGKPWWYWLTLFTRSWVDLSVQGTEVPELRPLVALTYQLNGVLGPGQAAQYHATNILLHLANALLVFVVARRVAGLSYAAAALSAALFAVLPSQAEVGAWIAARVESMAALFYLASFLAYVWWRQRGGWWRYGATFGLFILALFSKESAITLLGALVAYDFLVQQDLLRRLPWRLLGYLPFAALTGGYLWLRFQVFSEPLSQNGSLFQDRLTLQTVATFGSLQVVHLYMVLTGRTWAVAALPGPLRWPAHRLPFLEAAVLLLVAALLLLPWVPRGVRSGLGKLTFFGLAWWLISMVPLLATYESPRHAYLATVGLVVTFGLVLDRCVRSGWCTARAWGVINTVWLIVLATWTLQGPVQAWNLAGARSRAILETLQAQAAQAPPGTLLVIGAPGESIGGAFLWAWALPHAFRPPYTPAELSGRVELVATPNLWCCPMDQWAATTRQAIAAWARNPNQPPVLLATWYPAAGAPHLLSSASDPSLRQRVLDAASAATPEELGRRVAQLTGSPAATGH